MDLCSKHMTIRYGLLEPFYHQPVRDHVERMRGFAIKLIKDLNIQFDPTEVDALIMAHDLPELNLENDIACWDQEKQKGTSDIKEKTEVESMKHLATQYGDWIFDLWNEYSEQKTELAKFVKYMDRYEDHNFFVGKMLESGDRFLQTWGKPVPASEHLDFALTRFVKATLGFPTASKITRERLESLRAIATSHGLEKRLDGLLAQIKNHTPCQ